MHGRGRENFRRLALMPSPPGPPMTLGSAVARCEVRALPSRSTAAGIISVAAEVVEVRQQPAVDLRSQDRPARADLYSRRRDPKGRGPVEMPSNSRARKQAAHNRGKPHSRQAARRESRRQRGRRRLRRQQHPRPIPSQDHANPIPVLANPTGPMRLLPYRPRLRQSWSPRGNWSASFSRKSLPLARPLRSARYSSALLNAISTMNGLLNRNIAPRLQVTAGLVGPPPRC